MMISEITETISLARTALWHAALRYLRLSVCSGVSLARMALWHAALRFLRSDDMMQSNSKPISKGVYPLEAAIVRA